MPERHRHPAEMTIAGVRVRTIAAPIFTSRSSGAAIDHGPFPSRHRRQNGWSPEALPLAGGPNATFEGKPLLGG